MERISYLIGRGLLDIWIFMLALAILEWGWHYATEWTMKKTGMILAGGSGLRGAAMASDAVAYAEKFRQERIIQYNRDRTEVLRRLDIEAWKVFALRWNLAPPYPRGWGEEDDMLAVMHKTRLMLNEFSEQERIFSAAYLVGHSHNLPEGLIYEDGKLLGTAVQPTPPWAPQAKR